MNFWFPFRVMRIAAEITDIAARFGGPGRLGEMLGVSNRTVGMWATRGVIPHYWWDELLELAARHQVNLLRSELEPHAPKRRP